MMLQSLHFSDVPESFLAHSFLSAHSGLSCEPIGIRRDYAPQKHKFPWAEEKKDSVIKVPILDWEIVIRRRSLEALERYNAPAEQAPPALLI